MQKIDVALVPVSRRNAAKKRASMLLHAQCIDSQGGECTIRVRNLSETGLGGDVVKGLKPVPGLPVTLIIRHEHRVAARVVWVDGTRLGIAFDQRFDMGAMAQSWSGPGFEVSKLHANVGTDCKRPGIKGS